MNKNDNEQISVIIYYSYIYKIGGIESWIYNMCQQLCHYYNVKVLFDDGDINQLKRISNYVVIKKRDTNIEYKCDVLLVASYLNLYPINIKCKKCISVVHSDYEYYKGNVNCDSISSNTDQIVSVSQKASESLYSVTQRSCTVIPNILGNKIKTNKILHLVSFTRLSPEKGYDRMCILADKLKNNNIKFDWKIFSDIDNKNLDKLSYPEIIFMKPTLDIYDYIVDADYLVQLSDTEAYCYSVHESLQYGTPVIVTDLDVFNNVVVDGYNGYKFNLNMDNVNDDMIFKIVNNIPKNFIYDDLIEDTKNKWFDSLGEPSYSPELKLNIENVELEVVENYYDMQLNKNMITGERFKTNPIRAYELCGNNNMAGRFLCKEIK